MRHGLRIRAVAAASPVVLAAMAITTAGAAHADSASGSNARSGSVTTAHVQPPLTAAQALALSNNVTDKVIVLFRNQLRSIPDTAANAFRRTAAVRSTQAAVRAELAATHARNVKSLTLINAITATVSPGDARRLAGNPAIAQVVKDQQIPLAASSPARSARPAAGITPLPGACLPGTKVQLDPEALTNIHAATQSGRTSAQGMGYTGKIAHIHGGMNYIERQEQVERFRLAADEGGARFMLCTDAAAEGINLQFCWIMINYDVPWNPARLEQRMGRIHRYGQKAPQVVILNLVAPKTREGRVIETLLDKLERISLSGEPLRQARSVEVLERIGSPEARKILASLANGAPGARLTRDAAAALARLRDRK